MHGGKLFIYLFYSDNKASTQFFLFVNTIVANANKALIAIDFELALPSKLTNRLLN